MEIFCVVKGYIGKKTEAGQLRWAYPPGRPGGAKMEVPGGSRKCKVMATHSIMEDGAESSGPPAEPHRPEYRTPTCAGMPQPRDQYNSAFYSNERHIARSCNEYAEDRSARVHRSADRLHPGQQHQRGWQSSLPLRRPRSTRRRWWHRKCRGLPENFGGLGAEMLWVEDVIAAAQDLEANLKLASSSGCMQPSRADIPPPPKFDGTSTGAWQPPPADDMRTEEQETLQPDVPQQQVGSLDCGYHMLASMEHHLSNKAAAASNDTDRFLAKFTAKDVMQLRAYVQHAIYLGARLKKQESPERLEAVRAEVRKVKKLGRTQRRDHRPCAQLVL